MTTEERIALWLGIALLAVSVLFQVIQWYGITPIFLVPYASGLGLSFAFAFAVLVAFIAGRRTRAASPTLPEQQPTIRAKSDLVETESKLTLLKLGYQTLVKRDLLEIEPQLNPQDPKAIQFKSWNETEADLKKQYIDNLTVYEVVENIAKVLNEWNKDLERASLLMLEPHSRIHLYIQSCRKYYEKLRDTGFLSEEGGSTSLPTSSKQKRTKFEEMTWESDVGWHLPSAEQSKSLFSGEFEISGSDTASKLTCKQHGYNLELTGEMKCLKPKAPYTVYIGKCVTKRGLHPNIPDTIIRSSVVPHGNWEQFTTDERGNWSWNVRVNIDDLAEKAHEAKLGCIIVWVNDADAGSSILLSEWITIRRETEA